MSLHGDDDDDEDKQSRTMFGRDLHATNCMMIPKGSRAAVILSCKPAVVPDQTREQTDFQHAHTSRHHC
jgi:hypothetical protein